jgi:hypothetical protein
MPETSPQARPGDLEPVEAFRNELEKAMGLPIRVRATVVRATIFEAESTPEED